MTSSDFVCDSGNIQVIELDMLDMKKFLPFSLISSFSIRALIYPFSLVKTRIQVQPKNGIYGKTFRAFSQIYSKEGFRGLYRGYLINSFQGISSLFYVTTYEKVRLIMLDEFNVQNNSLRAFVGGGCACAVSQLIMVPLDVISQHMMILERNKPSSISSGRNHANFPSQPLDTLNLAKKLQTNPNLHLAPLIIREIYRRDGLFKGFYRGYLASLMCYVPSSSLLWCFYHFFCEKIFIYTPIDIPQYAMQAMAAPASGFLVALITNPLDLFRCNLQVRGTSWKNALHLLYYQEGLSVFTKGLPTRLFLLPLSSFLFMVGYEFVKRLSVREEIKNKMQSQ